jgi:hypothetical protein
MASVPPVPLIVAQRRERHRVGRAALPIPGVVRRAGQADAEVQIEVGRRRLPRRRHPKGSCPGSIAGQGSEVVGESRADKDGEVVADKSLPRVQERDDRRAPAKLLGHPRLDLLIISRSTADERDARVRARASVVGQRGGEVAQARATVLLALDFKQRCLLCQRGRLGLREHRIIRLGAGHP